MAAKNDIGIDLIGKLLREEWARALADPVPERMSCLLAQLHQADTKAREHLMFEMLDASEPTPRTTEIVENFRRVVARAPRMFEAPAASDPKEPRH